MGGRERSEEKEREGEREEEREKERDIYIERAVAIRRSSIMQYIQ